MVVAVGEMLDVGDLPAEIRGEALNDKGNNMDLRTIAQESSKIVEKKAIVDALSQHHGNVTRTAKALGTSRATVQKKMKIYGLQRHDFLKSAKT